MSFEFAIDKFGGDGEVVEIDDSTRDEAISRYELEPTDDPRRYIFHDGDGTSEVYLGGAGGFAFPRPLGTEGMERFLFGVLELTGGSLYSAILQGAITVDAEQCAHLPPELPAHVVGSWRELSDALRSLS